MANGQIMSGVHPSTECEGRECIIHNPTDHHMIAWPLLWRAEIAVFERRCPHGTGHPDPDQFSYWFEIGTEWRSVHGCDGCCVPVSGMDTHARSGTD